MTKGSTGRDKTRLKEAPLDWQPQEQAQKKRGAALLPACSHNEHPPHLLEWRCGQPRRAHPRAQLVHTHPAPPIPLIPGWPLRYSWQQGFAPS